MRVHFTVFLFHQPVYLSQISFSVAVKKCHIQTFRAYPARQLVVYFFILLALLGSVLNNLGKMGFDWHMALFNLVNFLILYFILKKYLFGSISATIAERQKKVADAARF